MADERGPDEEDIGMRVAEGGPPRSKTSGVVGEWHALSSLYLGVIFLFLTPRTLPQSSLHS